ncbi:MAG: chorismate mutase [Acidobacteriota bacterium]|nr:chorismate mutase [Acidobacteriota bacterium]
MKMDEWRNEIDAIDAEIVNLINRRARIAQKIGILKAKAGLPIVDLEREEAILRNACARSSSNSGGGKGALENDSIARIFKRIIQECRQVQVEAIGKIIDKGTKIFG